MPLRDRLRRLQKAVRGDMDWLELQAGTRYYFEPMQARQVLFAEMMDVLHTEFAHIPDLSEGPLEPEVREPASEQDVSELRAALAKATPESLRRFEERYGPAEHKCGVVYEDGRVEYARLRPAPDGSGDELDR